jgi:hypothetical protein
MIIPPSNIILSNQYTAGGELVYASSNLPYQGYYYELNDKFFVGKTFDPNSPELLKIGSNKINTLKSNPLTSAYSNASNQPIPNTELKSIPYSEGLANIKFIAKKINSGKIFFISEEDYKNNQNNPLYTLIKVKYNMEFGFDNSLTPENFKAIPEIGTFLGEFSNQDEYE